MKFSWISDHTTCARIRLHHARTLTSSIGSPFAPASIDTAGLYNLRYRHAPTFIFPPDRFRTPMRCNSDPMRCQWSDNRPTVHVSPSSPYSGQCILDPSFQCWGRKVQAKAGSVSQDGKSIEEKDKAEGTNAKEREGEGSRKHERRRRETKREGKGRQETKGNQTGYRRVFILDTSWWATSTGIRV